MQDFQRRRHDSEPNLVRKGREDSLETEYGNDSERAFTPLRPSTSPDADEHDSDLDNDTSEEGVEETASEYDDFDDDRPPSAAASLSRSYMSESTAAPVSPTDPPPKQDAEMNESFTTASTSPVVNFYTLPFSLWEYLQQEISAADVDESQDLKSERITNFVSVPMAIERMIIFGLFVCFDSFLYTFSILPVRFCRSMYQLVCNYANLQRGKRKQLSVSQKGDIVKGLLVLFACLILHHITDTSRMYHSVRGQDTLKLYVIYNVLEIADRLCCSFGHDLLDSLCSRSTLGRRSDGSQPRIRPVILFGMTLLYTLAHTLVLFYQLVTLNVAINSYSNALLTLLMSNQFVEIKGAVFKKFEKENLFQMSCADIVERFQLTLVLTIIALRNLIEVSGSTFSTLPASYISISIIPSFSVIHRIFTPAFIVLVSEMLVDWLKHAFITKFNHIRPAVYGRFIDVLCKDLIPDRSSKFPFVDNSPALSRRLGFAAMPLGCLVIRVMFQIADMMTDVSHIDECSPRHAGLGGRGWLASIRLPDWRANIARWSLVTLVMISAWALMVVLKLVIGIQLRAYAASRLPTMQTRIIEDKLNSRSRDAIGLGQSEKESDKLTSALVGDAAFDASDKRQVKLESADEKRVINMDNLGRFDIVKSRLY